MKRLMTLQLLLIAVVVFFIMGCAEDDGNKKINWNTWTLEQVGGEDFMETTTAIKITFKRSVQMNEKGENLNNFIDVMGAAYRDGVITKDGNGWLIPIEVEGPGTATVIISDNNREIEFASKPVVVYMHNEFAPITWTAVPNGDKENSTNQLMFTFTGDIQDPFFLTAGMIIIEPDETVENIKQRGNALVTGVLTLPGYIFDVSVNTSSGGWVLVTLDMDGVDTYPQRLRIIRGTNDEFKPPKGSGDSQEEVEDNGDKVAFNWTVLKITNPHEDYGYGRITGTDLQKIRDAYKKDNEFYNSQKPSDPTIKMGYGSFIRIYVDISSVIPAETGHAMLAVGNLDLPWDGVEDGKAMQNYTLQPIEGTPVGPGIVTMDVPLRFIFPEYCKPAENYLLINAWSGCIVHAVVLYQIETPLKLIRPAKWQRDITITGTASRIGGAGAYFTYYDQKAMEEAPQDAWMEFYVKGSGAGTWGSTGYNWTVGRAGCVNLTSSTLINDSEWGRYNKILLSTIEAASAIGSLDRNTLNPYAGSAFDKVWLCWE